jgi:hypothetical protein
MIEREGVDVSALTIEVSDLPATGQPARTSPGVPPRVNTALSSRVDTVPRALCHSYETDISIARLFICKEQVVGPVGV